MAASVHNTPSTAKNSPSMLLSSPLHIPDSDKRFWSSLQNRVDSILEKKLQNDLTDQEELNLLDIHVENVGESDRAKRMKEDSLMLLRGFDSIAHTLSQLSNNLDNALMGARCLAEPPTLSEIFRSNLRNSDRYMIEKQQTEGGEGDENEQKKKGTKRKLDSTDSPDDTKSEPNKDDEEIPKDNNMKKAKNLAISMAKRAASLARELKSMKSDLCFMQERCSLLEEENKRLRDGFVKGVRPEEDDLMRLQMEALLAEKSRLANENANLIRENRCLHQLVEYLQFTSQDVSASYEQLLHGMCLDFSSPLSAEIEGQGNADDVHTVENPGANIFGFSTSLDGYFDDEKQ